MSTAVVAAATSTEADMPIPAWSTHHRAVLGAAAAALAVACHDFPLGVSGPEPVQVAVAPDTLRVGDSATVVVTLHDGSGRVVTRPSGYRLSVSDAAVASLRGTWLVGRRAGRVVVRAESGGRADEALVVITE